MPRTVRDGTRDSESPLKEEERDVRIDKTLCKNAARQYAQAPRIRGVKG